jgi:hypothetical protein
MSSELKFEPIHIRPDTPDTLLRGKNIGLRSDTLHLHLKMVSPYVFSWSLGLARNRIDAKLELGLGPMPVMERISVTNDLKEQQPLYRLKPL